MAHFRQLKATIAYVLMVLSGWLVAALRVVPGDYQIVVGPSTDLP